MQKYFYKNLMSTYKALTRALETDKAKALLFSLWESKQN